MMLPFGLQGNAVHRHSHKDSRRMDHHSFSATLGGSQAALPRRVLPANSACPLARHGRRLQTQPSSRSRPSSPTTARAISPAGQAPVTPQLGLFPMNRISSHLPLRHYLTPDFLHQERPTKAQIFAPCAFLLCPASLCSTQTLLDSPSIHVIMGKRAAPDLRHEFTRRPPTTGQESWLR